ncbi:MAG: MBL fold metallo-hydrolase [Acidobacteriota bacterium]
MKNGFVVSCESTSEGILIDPGEEVDMLVREARAAKVTVTGILLTHAHLDHITGVGRAKAAFDVPVWLHREDLFLYDAVVEQGLMFGIRTEAQPKIDAFYAVGVPIRFGEYVIDVLHTPGHCPGGVCLAVGRANGAERELFVGDTLFAGSIGRTDLPGGDHQQLLSSIRNVLLAFPDSSVVHSGHGPDTTIGRERQRNPFLTGER